MCCYTGDPLGPGTVHIAVASRSRWALDAVSHVERNSDGSRGRDRHGSLIEKRLS